LRDKWDHIDTSGGRCGTIALTWASFTFECKIFQQRIGVLVNHINCFGISHNGTRDLRSFCVDGVNDSNTLIEGMVVLLMRWAVLLMGQMLI
jgi:hypothetical protein